MGEDFRAKKKLGKHYKEIRVILEEGGTKYQAWWKAKQLGVSYRKTEMYKDFDEIKERIERQNLFEFYVVQPLQERWGMNRDEVYKRIDQLRNQQYLTFEDLDDYKEYIELYRGVFG